MDQEQKKKKAAKKALEILLSNINKDTVLGIGTGSTTDYFTQFLIEHKLDFKGVICSSKKKSELFKDSGLSILELNEVHELDYYIDGADEFNKRLELIKGGGGALTREKILSNSSKIFICIVDDSKFSEKLGSFPLPIEVIKIARSAISRELLKMGGRPVYREGFISDNGNQIIDVHNLDITVPYEMEQKLNFIPGVVENGIFSKRPADIILKATHEEVRELR